MGVRLVDGVGVPCLDARNVVRFALAGDGALAVNLGTAGGSRQVELANGRATIGVRMGRGRAALSVSAAGIPTAIRLIEASDGRAGTRPVVGG
jgi:beta-galactosidase